MTDEAFDVESDSLIAAPSPAKIDAFAAKWAQHPGCEVTVNAAAQAYEGGVDDFYVDTP
jgi:hypothetical protein